MSTTPLSRPNNPAVPLREYIDSAIRELAALPEHDPFRDNTALMSGLYSLDRLLGTGFQRGDYTVLAGRTGIGKSGLALSLARGFASLCRGIYVAAGMSARQVAMRAIAADRHISAFNLIAGWPTNVPHWHGSLSGLINNIHVLAHPSISLRTIERAVVAGRDIDVKWLIVDYINFVVSSHGESREREVSTVSAALKRIAARENIVVVGVAQLSREAGHGLAPRLEHVAESDAIVRDADTVLLLHRPEKYGIDYDELGNYIKGIADVIVAKHRNGPAGGVARLHWDEESISCENLTDGPDSLQGRQPHATPAHAPARRPYQDDPYRDDDDDPF